MSFLHFLMKTIYDTLWHGILAGWIAFSFVKNMPVKQKKQEFSERLVLYPRIAWKQKPVLWFHASSLGEVLSFAPFLKGMRKEFPHSQLLSTSTSRGREVADSTEADKIVYLPLDHAILVKKAMRKIRPHALLVFETEIWPNLFLQCKENNVPMFVISGRISPRSFPRYKMAKPFLKTVLEYPFFLMQSQEDAKRILELGACPEKVQCVGNIKFDGIQACLSENDRDWLKNTFGFSFPTIVAGSTHPGEEEILLSVFQRLKATWPGLRLILAPRHLNRIGEIIGLLKSLSLPFELRSSLSSSPSANITCDQSEKKKARILLLDTYGELSKVYEIADIVFVGGTLVPIGGHNLLEPAALAKPIVIGKHFFTCKEQVQMFLSQHAISLVSSPEELESEIFSLLLDQAKAKRMGNMARDLVLANQGSLRQAIKIVCQILQSSKNLT